MKIVLGLDLSKEQVLSKLKQLNLASNDITFVEADALNGLLQLETLNLVNNRVGASGGGLPRFSQPWLTHLNLVLNGLTDDHVNAIKALSPLILLCIGEDDIPGSMSAETQRELINFFRARGFPTRPAKRSRTDEF